MSWSWQILSRAVVNTAEEEFLDQINDYQLLNNRYPLWRWFEYYYWYLAGKSALKACTYLRAVTAYVHTSRWRFAISKLCRLNDWLIDYDGWGYVS
jgi:hypothetical protein